MPLIKWAPHENSSILIPIIGKSEYRQALISKCVSSKLMEAGLFQMNKYVSQKHKHVLDLVYTNSHERTSVELTSNILINSCSRRNADQHYYKNPSRGSFQIRKNVRIVEGILYSKCILVDKKAGKQGGLLHPIPKKLVSLNSFHMDHLGPIQSTKKNYNHISSVIDAFTKFVWLFPVKLITANETLSKLQIITVIFGNPNRIVADKGSAFKSNDFNDFCKDVKKQKRQLKEKDNER